MKLLVLYNFYISYIKETENIKTDILNRKLEYKENKIYKLYIILK
ncbi:hypothetical protein CJF30_00005115 [Rutstroemia sp. NJR-2017a BBW]|nr:hypothetical protein CJF30_00005115 [Rutstroemia sp. NJR-2017a BBW]